MHKFLHEACLLDKTLQKYFMRTNSFIIIIYKHAVAGYFNEYYLL